jgi:hypothetical protein
MSNDPDVCFKSPTKTLMSVVFPEPFGPTMCKKLPFERTKETFFNA